MHVVLMQACKLGEGVSGCECPVWRSGFRLRVEGQGWGRGARQAGEERGREKGEGGNGAGERKASAALLFQERL